MHVHAWCTRVGLTGQVLSGLVRQLTRGIPSLVPVPIKMISDWPLEICAPTESRTEPVQSPRITNYLDLHASLTKKTKQIHKPHCPL